MEPTTWGWSYQTNSDSGCVCSAEQRDEAGSGLSHHATGFGVSLGKEPWASKVSDISPNTLYLVSHPQKPMGIHLFSRVPSGSSKHRFPPNFYFPY